MAFTLISISRLDKAGYQVTFKKGMCTIFNPKGQVIAMIPMDCIELLGSMTRMEAWQQWHQERC